MIIFDLDGTLADCEHRRHFVEFGRQIPCGYLPAITVFENEIDDEKRGHLYHAISKKKWHPNWEAFYGDCDLDHPIKPVVEIFTTLSEYNDIEIWSARCESVREKTIRWLKSAGSYDELAKSPLKMRRIGDSTPDDILKERWLDEALAQGKKIDFVFDDRPKVIRMWRRRGIFVFNCCQHDREF